MNREQALEILHEFTKSESLRKHALAVEACVTAYARKLGADEEQWSVTALLHDFDWEIHPTLPDHPMKGEPIVVEKSSFDRIIVPRGEQIAVFLGDPVRANGNPVL